MDSFYIRQKNLCIQDIKQAETYKKQSENSLKNLRSKSDKTSFDLTQINSYLKKIEKYDEDIQRLKNRLEDIQKKKLNSEFVEESNKSIQANKIYNEKKEKQKKDKEIIQKQTSKFESISKNVNRYNDVNFVSEKQLDYEYKKYINAYNNIPDRTQIKKNLKEMPCNKGYIWNGIWFFGELPEEEGKPLIMFEKIQNSNTLRIYEIDDKYKYVYEKNGKDRKVLIEKEERSNFYKHIAKQNSNWF